MASLVATTSTLACTHNIHAHALPLQQFRKYFPRIQLLQLILGAAIAYIELPQLILELQQFICLTVEIRPT